MATVEHSETLPATPEQVFDLLERVEDFADYSDLITAIEAQGNEHYRWYVHAIGVDWTFDVKVTEKVRPSVLAWHSVDGVSNQGRYELEAVPEGTRVKLILEYEIRNRLVARAVQRAAKPLVGKVSSQILHRVEERLKGQY